MNKIDPTVKKETKYIAYWVFLLSVIMQAVFIVIGKWNYTVLLGNLLTAVAGVLNFFFMGITVQKALTKDEKAAKSTMRVSQLYRMLFLVVVVVVGVYAPCFDMWAVLIPLFFTRIAVGFRPFINRK